VIEYNMPASEYHRLPRASKSGLDKIARSPAHYKCRDQKEPSKAMRIGTALHSLVLEGVAPLVMPEFSGKGSVALRDEWKQAHAGALVLSEDEALDVHGMAASIALHPIAGPAFARKDGRAEVSALWTCPDTGVECKSRFDWLLPSAIVDLKTTADASPDAFARSVASYRYHCQDAFYSQAAASCDLSVDHFLFVVVETSAPYAVAIYQLDDEARDIGRRLYLRDLRRLKECRERNEWPGYPTDISTLSLPKWATYGVDGNE
jgi:exodeoxyribonuclease VIII